VHPGPIRGAERATFPVMNTSLLVRLVGRLVGRWGSLSQSLRGSLRGSLLGSLRGSLLLGALLGALSPAAQADRTPVRATDLLRLRTVSTIDVARDGSRAIFAVRSIEPGEWRGDDATYSTRQNLWSVRLDQERAGPRQLTVGTTVDSECVLSPDGSRMAFVRSAGAGAAGQVWVMPLDGGEARPITSFAEGARQPAWSPDGHTLVVVSPVLLNQFSGTPEWPLDRPGRTWNDEPFSGTADAPEASVITPEGDRAAERAWLARNASKANPLATTRLEFVDDTSVRSRWTFDQLFLVDADAPEAPPTRLTRAFANHREPSFLRNGQRVVCTTVRAGEGHLDRSIESRLVTISRDGRDEQTLLARQGWSFEAAQPRHDDDSIAFRGRPMDEPAFRQWRLGVIAAGGGEPVWLTDGLDRSVQEFRWAGTDDSLLFTVADRGGFPLLSLSPAVMAPIDVLRSEDELPVGVHAFGAGGGATVMARTTVEEPCVLFLHDLHGTRELVDLNEWVGRRSLSKPVRVEVVRGGRTPKESLTIEGWIMEPIERRPGRRVPLVVAIHGGPNAMWGPGELTTWHELQFLCGRGFGVVYCNPRGSGGYGEEFERANRQNWGPGPAGDVLAVADVAAALPWVDREQMVVTGGSYGGYLTAFLVTREKRFRAAVADRGVYDFQTFFGEGSAWRLVDWAFGGFAFDLGLKDVLQTNSITASQRTPATGLHRVETPLLIMHGTKDRRTGVAQSEMLYRALRFLGKPVEYVRYPDADHEMSRRGDPRQRIDRLLRTVEFFERFVGEGRRPAGP